MNAKQIRTAKQFADRGIRIVPQFRNKKGNLTGWPELATTDHSLVDKWSSGPYSDANFAAVCGLTSGVVVLDADMHEGGPDGLRSLAKIEELHGSINTYKVSTPGGGLHLYFKYPNAGKVPTISNLAEYPGIEILSDGHLCTLPGSLRGTTGAEYRIIDDIEFLPCPVWLIALAETAKTAKQDKTGFLSPPQGGKIPVTARHAAALKMVARKWNSGAFDSPEELLAAARLWYAVNCEGDPDPGELEEMVNGWIEKHPDPGKEKQQKQADIIVSLALDAIQSLWTTDDDREFCTMHVGGHTENIRLQGTAFKNLIANIYYKATGTTVSENPLKDAKQTLCGLAMFGDDAEKHISYVRVAPYEDCIYFDLGRPDWKVVRIEAGSWTVTDECPCRFERPPGMLPIELPDPDGDIRALRPFVNAADDNTWVLIAAWLINTLRPTYSQPILVVTGEQSSAKTTLCRVLRSIVDPNISDMRCAPRELRDLAIAARNGWIITVDNLSGMRDWLSDGFCRLATGGGMSVRKHYTNDEEELFQAIRPVMLNGIGQIVARPDLMDRSVILQLPTIKETARIPESDFYEQVKEARPRILGGILNCVACALDNLDAVELIEIPRMADFSIFVTAAAEVLEWDPHTFVNAYFENRKNAHELILENSPLAAALMRLKLPIIGTATEILQLITENSETKDLTKLKGFPGSVRGLSTELDRMAPNLREIGMFIVRYREENQRMIRIERET